MGDRSDRARNAAFVLFGAFAFLLLHLLFVSTWPRFLTAGAWPGYEAAARAGLIEPWFVNSPRSLWLTRATFFLVAFVIAARLRDRRASALFAVWIGAGAAVAVLWQTTKSHTADWGWLGSILYPFRLLLPIAIGASAAIITQNLVRLRKPSS